GENRSRRAAAVAVAFQPPATANERRRCLDIPIGELPQRLRVDSGFVSRAIDAPRTGRGTQAFPADRVLREERMVGAPLFEKDPVQRERKRQVRSGADCQMQVRLLRQAGASGIYDDESGAVALRIAQVRDEVYARC